MFVYSFNPLKKCYVSETQYHRNYITEKFVTFHIKINGL